jgi:hypothetical protein
MRIECGHCRLEFLPERHQLAIEAGDITLADQPQAWFRVREADAFPVGQDAPANVSDCLVGGVTGIQQLPA